MAPTPSTDPATPHAGASPSCEALPRMRRRFALLRQHLTDAGLALREPPPEPTTCCGRGCNGCVWDGFYAAAEWWCEDAEDLLAASPPDTSRATSSPVPPRSGAPLPHCDGGSCTPADRSNPSSLSHIPPRHADS